MKKLIAILFFSIVLLSANASNFSSMDDSIRYPKPYLHNYFTFNPLQIFEIEPSFQDTS